VSQHVISGRVWKFGDNVSTDYMMPSFAHSGTPAEMAQYCMYSIRPEFAASVQPGDIIVGGRNFGCGSSRPASNNLATLGIACVVAESLARIFFRNSINLGFPVLPCPGVYDAFEEGDMMQVDFDAGEVKNLTTGIVLHTDTLPDTAARILEAGGVVELLRREYGKQN
jgi:3-isopropylmalate/(R)-2-methylmalate dehydratase small subunit